MKREKQPPRIRNAYAVPARGRRNAGPMTHKRPPRERGSALRTCERCGAVLDDDDLQSLCSECFGQRRDFDAVARTWDEEPRRLRLASEVAIAMQRAVALSPKSEALDIGCGTGLVTLALAPHVGVITGADGSREMLDVLDEKARSHGIENVRTAKIDLNVAAPLGGSYDLVVSSMTLHHVRNIDALFGRILEALRPGGFAALADLEPDGGAFHANNTGVFHFGFDPADIGRRLERVGFSDVRLSHAAIITKEIAGAPRDFRVFLAVATRPV
jgi:SAM-dependent methyltransferase